MDGLSTVASIITVIQLASAVLKFCYSMKQRNADLKEIIYRLETLRNVFYRLNDLETRCPPGSLTGLSELCAGPLLNCERIIKELQSRLTIALGALGVRGLGKRVTWPVEKKRNRSIAGVH